MANVWALLACLACALGLPWLAKSSGWPMSEVVGPIMMQSVLLGFACGFYVWWCLEPRKGAKPIWMLVYLGVAGLGNLILP